MWAGKTLYLSGLPGFNFKDSVLAKGLVDQTKQMARNHAAILEAAIHALAEKGDDGMGGVA